MLIIACDKKNMLRKILVISAELQIRIILLFKKLTLNHMDIIKCIWINI